VKKTSKIKRNVQKFSEKDRFLSKVG